MVWTHIIIMFLQIIFIEIFFFFLYILLVCCSVGFGVSKRELQVHVPSRLLLPRSQILRPSWTQVFQRSHYWRGIRKTYAGTCSQFAWILRVYIEYNIWNIIYYEMICMCRIHFKLWYISWNEWTSVFRYRVTT